MTKIIHFVGKLPLPYLGDGANDSAKKIAPRRICLSLSANIL